MDLKKLGVGQRVVITLAVTVALTIVVTAAGGAFSAESTTVAPETQKHLKDLKDENGRLKNDKRDLRTQLDAFQRKEKEPVTQPASVSLAGEAAFPSIVGTISCIRKVTKVPDNGPVAATLSPPGDDNQENWRLHLTTEPMGCPPTVEICLDKIMTRPLNVGGPNSVNLKLNVKGFDPILTIFRPVSDNSNDILNGTKSVELKSSQLTVCQPKQ